ncbi:RadC family protein [Carnimonas bestiolae]|uniref:RadC family protein n=1 Tax=Carnimonas bestiolae TaxID=3402172 RepID=UPI003EDC3861
MSIKHWPANERPREKAVKHGVRALSDAELLAIFLRVGITGMSAVDVARQQLLQFGGLRELLCASQLEFCRGKGFGMAAFVTLQAALELGRRHYHSELAMESAFESPNAVRRFLVAQLRDFDHEVFSALFLDSQHRMLEFEHLFHGTLNAAAVYPREVIKKALAHGAAAIIFAHNHPSGTATPSEADIRLTRRLTDGLALVDIKVLDHFVVGDGEVVSFAERGLL